MNVNLSVQLVVHFNFVVIHTLVVEFQRRY